MLNNVNNLYIKHKNDTNLLDKIDKFKTKLEIIDKHEKFNVGDLISFWGGYHNHIRYTSKIFGFDESGDIYVIWDCYWLPLTNDDKRKIELIKED